MEVLKITSQFGHEVMSCNFAAVSDLAIAVVPSKDIQEEYDAEVQKIFDNMRFFSATVFKVPFEERHKYQHSLDVVRLLKDEKLPDDCWREFARTRLSSQDDPDTLTQYPGLEDEDNILVIPQKLLSDGECGVSAAQQSLPLEVFDFLIARPEKPVLGQHFHKINDRPIVEDLVKRFDGRLYVPGLTENEHVFGIRGVQHREYYNMYRQLKLSVGIAGTHTWYLLTMFPEIPQVILYNKSGVEHWPAIAEAYRKQGKQIYAIGFDENTDMSQLSKEVEAKVAELLG